MYNFLERWLNKFKKRRADTPNRTLSFTCILFDKDTRKVEVAKCNADSHVVQLNYDEQMFA